jgi:hypothetical protein
MLPSIEKKSRFSGRPTTLLGWIVLGLILGFVAVAAQIFGSEAVKYFTQRTNERDQSAKNLKSSSNPISSGVIVGFCPILPISERGGLSIQCQQLNAENDIETTRFNECFRLLNVEGVQNGKCDSASKRYVLDLNNVDPRVLVIGANGATQGQMNLSRKN